MEDRIKKWRLILGKKADPSSEITLEGDLKKMDAVLDALYDSERKKGLGKSSPNVNRWLGDIRNFFPTPVVKLLQNGYTFGFLQSQQHRESEFEYNFIEFDINSKKHIFKVRRN